MFGGSGPDTDGSPRRSLVRLERGRGARVHRPLEVVGNTNRPSRGADARPPEPHPSRRRPRQPVRHLVHRVSPRAGVNRTVPIGTYVDRSALFGIIDQLESLGLGLLTLESYPVGDEPAAPGAEPRWCPRAPPQSPEHNPSTTSPEEDRPGRAFDPPV